VKVYQDIEAVVQATHAPPEGPNTVDGPRAFRIDPPTESDYGPLAHDDTTWDLSALAGGAKATSTGTVTWDITPCRIKASGTFKESATGGDAEHTAVTALEARIQIRPKVTRFSRFTLAGTVKANGTPITGGNPLFQFAKCSGNFDVTGEADVLNPNGMSVPFGESAESALYAEDGHEYRILCGVVRGGGAASGFPSSTGDITWEWTMTFLGD
jgi:hypothetical protein